MPLRTSAALESEEAVPRRADIVTVARFMPHKLGDLGSLIDEWTRALRSEGKSPRTVEKYLESMAQFVVFLRGHGMPERVGSIHREHVEAFVVDLIERHSKSTAVTRFQSLRQMFNYLAT